MLAANLYLFFKLSTCADFFLLSAVLFGQSQKSIYLCIKLMFEEELKIFVCYDIFIDSRLSKFRLFCLSMLKKFFSIATLFLLYGMGAYAQQMGAAVNTFLDYPASAHIAALGGNNVSSFAADGMSAVSNPAMLSTDFDNLLHLNYSIYMVSSGYGSAAYNFSISDYDAFSVGFLFAEYGKMQGYDENGVYTGDFSAQDFALYATYSRRLNKYFRIGATVKPILSTYETYTSFSLGADLGVQYIDTVKLWSVGLAVRNIGGRIAKPYGVEMGANMLPINVTLGFTKRFTKAPFAINVSMQNLQKWDYDFATNDYGDNAGVVNAGLMIARKFIIGLDIMPKSDKFWISLAYNFDRGMSLSNPYVLSLAGLSGGVGFKLYMFSIGAAVACYSTSAVTAHFSLAMDINGFNKKKL